MHLVVHAADLQALEEVFLDGLVAGRSQQGGQHVFVGADVIDDGAGLDGAGPLDHRRYAVAAFPVGVLLATEHGGAAIGPGEGFGPVVGRIHDDGVVIQAKFLEFGQHLSDMPVMLDHAIGINAQTGLAFRLFLQAREDVHAGGVPPHEERLVCFLCSLHEVKRLGIDFLVDGFHPLLGERPGIGHSAIGKAVDHATRTKALLEGRIFRVVGMLWLFFGIEVIEVAEKLIESMLGRQGIVGITKVIFAELTGHVAL